MKNLSSIIRFRKRERKKDKNQTENFESISVYVESIYC